MKLSWLSWALAIIFVMAIMDAPIAEAKAVASPEAEADADASADADAEAEAKAIAGFGGLLVKMGKVIAPMLISEMPKILNYMKEKMG